MGVTDQSPPNHPLPCSWSFDIEHCSSAGNVRTLAPTMRIVQQRELTRGIFDETVPRRAVCDHDFPTARGVGRYRRWPAARRTPLAVVASRCGSACRLVVLHPFARRLSSSRRYGCRRRQEDRRLRHARGRYRLLSDVRRLAPAVRAHLVTPPAVLWTCRVYLDGHVWGHVVSCGLFSFELNISSRAQHAHGSGRRGALPTLG